MDVRALIGDRLAAMPEELLPVIDDLVAGRVRSMVLLVELDDGEIGDLYSLDMNGSQSNRLAVLGAIENLKRDFMRDQLESRVRYVETRDDDDGE